MKKHPKAGLAKIDVLGTHLPEVKKIFAVDVERYNELNVRLLENKNYAVMYLSGKRTHLNTFQQFHHLSSYDEISTHAWKKPGSEFFHRIMD